MNSQSPETASYTKLGQPTITDAAQQAQQALVPENVSVLQVLPDCVSGTLFMLHRSRGRIPQGAIGVGRGANVCDAKAVQGTF